MLEVWGEAGNLVRRLVRAEDYEGGLRLWARRFGGGEVRIEVYDRTKRATAVEGRAHRAAIFSAAGAALYKPVNVAADDTDSGLHEQQPQFGVATISEAVDGKTH